MELTADIKKYIEQSVLCWLATSSPEGAPNVSPKEVFTNYGHDCILIANIASPNSVKNIIANSQVCVSFIDILVQKGYQLKGNAVVVKKDDPGFADLEKPLLDITQGKYPFASIIKVKVTTAKSIIAPSYILFPDTTEDSQIESARKSYGL